MKKRVIAFTLCSAAVILLLIITGIVYIIAKISRNGVARIRTDFEVEWIMARNDLGVVYWRISTDKLLHGDQWPTNLESKGLNFSYNSTIVNGPVTPTNSVVIYPYVGQELKDGKKILALYITPSKFEFVLLDDGKVVPK